MAKAYIVFIKEETLDASELAQYKSMVGHSFEGHEVEFLATYGEQEVLEDADAQGVVILGFAHMAAARAWYHSEAYQRARDHRFKGARYRTILVEGRA